MINGYHPHWQLDDPQPDPDSARQGDLVEPIEKIINLIRGKVEIKPKEKRKPEIRRVGLDYPNKSGLQKDLEDQGCILSWSIKDMDVGSEPVIQEQDDGTRIMFKDEAGTLTLLQKKK